MLGSIPVIVARSGLVEAGWLRNLFDGQSIWNSALEQVKEAGRAYQIGPGAPNYIERVGKWINLLWC